MNEPQINVDHFYHRPIYFDLKTRVAVRDQWRRCRQDGLDPLG
jgi:hypothetical protein